MDVLTVAQTKWRWTTTKPNRVKESKQKTYQEMQQQNVQEVTKKDQLEETNVVQAASQQTSLGGTGGQTGIGVRRSGHFLYCNTVCVHVYCVIIKSIIIENLTEKEILDIFLLFPLSLKVSTRDEHSCTPSLQHS